VFGETLISSFDKQLLPILESNDKPIAIPLQTLLNVEQVCLDIDLNDDNDSIDDCIDGNACEDIPRLTKSIKSIIVYQLITI
jgi:hypothetical protein